MDSFILAYEPVRIHLPLGLDPSEELNELETKATFFVTGEAARARPDGVRAIDAGGHDIGGLACTPTCTGTKPAFRKCVARNIYELFADNLFFLLGIVVSVTCSYLFFF